jgi:hypothetical protein
LELLRIHVSLPNKSALLILRYLLPWNNQVAVILVGTAYVSGGLLPAQIHRLVLRTVGHGVLALLVGLLLHQRDLFLVPGIVEARLRRLQVHVLRLLLPSRGHVFLALRSMLAV